MIEQPLDTTNEQEVAPKVAPEDKIVTVDLAPDIEKDDTEYFKDEFDGEELESSEMSNMRESTLLEAQRLFTLAASAMDSGTQEEQLDNPEAVQRFLSDIKSNNVTVVKGALQNVIDAEGVPISAKQYAASKLGELIEFQNRDENLPLQALALASEKLADDFDDLESTSEIISKKTTPDGQLAHTSYQSAQSVDHLYNMSVLEKSGNLPAMAQYAYHLSRKNADIISTDFAAVAVTGAEVVWGVNMLKYINNPKINAYLEKTSVKGAPVGPQFAFGNFKKELGNILYSMPEKESMEVLRKAVEYHKEMWKIDGAGNKWVYYSMMEGLTRGIRMEGAPESTPEKAIRYMENLGGVADAYAMGVLAKAPLSLGKRLLSGVFAETARVAPTATATKIALDMLEGERSLARSGLGSYGEAFEIGLAKHRDNLEAANMSQELAGKVALLSMGQNETYRQLQQAIFGSKPAELNAQQLTEGMKTYLGRRGLVGQPSVSEIASDGENILVNGRFGSKDGAGFESKVAAEAAAIKSMGKDTFGLSIRHKESGIIITKDSDKWTEFEKFATNKATANEYEWFVESAYKTNFDNVYNLPDFVDYGVVGQKTGVASNIMFDVSATRILGTLWDAQTSATLKWHAGNEKHVQSLFKNLSAPEIDVLNSAERSQVMRAVYENAGKDKILSEAELVAAGVTSDAAKLAYYSYTRGMAIAHSIADRGLARSLRSDGFKKIFGSDDKMLNLAKEVDVGEIPVRNTVSVRVIDKNGIRTERMSISQLDTAKKSGAGLYRHKMAEWVGDEEVAYSVISKDVLSKSVGDIGIGGVLPYSAGYFPEMMRGQVSVYGVTAQGNKWLLGTSETTKDAAKLIEDFYKTPEMTKKYVKFDQEYFSGYKDALQTTKRAQEIYENLQGVVYGHKSGNDIINASGMNAVSNKLDPLEAADAMFSVLANNYTKGSFIQYRNKQFHEFAKANDLLSADTIQSGRIATTIEDLRDPAMLKGKQLAAYNSARRWAATTEGFELNPDFVSRGVSWMMKKAATMAASKLPFLESWALSRAQKWGNPLGVFAGINYVTSIVMSPHRQFFMNSAQQLSNVVHPVAMTKAIFKQHHSFQQALYYYQDAAIRGVFSDADLDKALASHAKDIGVSLAEMKGMIRAYLEGGLWNQVAHSTKIRGTMKTELEMRTLKAMSKNQTTVQGSRAEDAKNLLSKYFVTAPMKAVENAGFAFGEHQNTLTTFLTLFNANRKNKAFDVTTDSGRKMLSGKTMEWIGNMTPEGRVGFQKALGASWFQFTAFGYKQAVNILPAFLGGSKLLTNSEKFSLALSQAIMFGSDATIFGKAIRASIEEVVLKSEDITEEERSRRLGIWNELNAGDQIEQGVVNGWGNNMISGIGYAFFGEDAPFGDPNDKILLNQYMSLSASPEFFYERLVRFGELIDEWRDADSVNDYVKVSINTLGGTGGKKLTGFYDFAAIAGRLIGTAALNEDLLSEEERMRLYKGGIVTLARQGSGLMNDAMLLRAEEHFESKGIRDVAAADTIRKRIATAFGIPMESDEAYFAARKANKKLSNFQDSLGAPTKQRADAIRGQVNTFWTYILKQSESVPPDSDAKYIEAVREDTETTIKLLLVTLPKDDRQEIVDGLRKRLADAQAGGGSEAELSRRLIGEVQMAPNGKGNMGFVLDMLFSKFGKRDPVLQQIGSDWLSREQDIKTLEGTQEE
jgi:hypothetical protein